MALLSAQHSKRFDDHDLNAIIIFASGLLAAGQDGTATLVYQVLTLFLSLWVSLLRGLGLKEEDEMYDFNPDPNATDLLVGRPVADVERDLILATLRETGGNRTHAADILRISIRTLRNKLSVYNAEGYDVPEPGQAAH
jgi:two-component system response regulator FlrC